MPRISAMAAALELVASFLDRMYFERALAQIKSHQPTAPNRVKSLD